MASPGGPARDAPLYSTAGAVITTVNLFNGSVSPGNLNISTGAFPEAVAVDAATDRAYVADLGSDTVSVLNATTTAPVGIIPVGLGPDGITVDPANDRIFVTNNYSDNLSVLDGATGEVIDSLPVGSDPQAAAFDAANGLVYVANGGWNSTTIINASTDALVGTIPVGNWPDAVAVDPVLDRVYVGNGASDSITVLNGSDQALVGTVPLRSNVTGLAVDPGTGYLFASESATDDLVVIGAANDSVVRSIPVELGPLGVAVDPASGLAFVADYASFNVTVINESNDTIVAEDGGLEGPWGATYDPAAGTILVPNIYDGEVTVINGSTGRVVASAPVGFATSAVAVNTLDGAIYVGGENSISILNGSTYALEGTLNVSAAALLFDPSDNSLYVADGNANVDVFNGTTAALVATIPTGGYPDALALGPGSELYVANGGAGTVSEIYTPTNYLVASNFLGPYAGLTGLCVNNASGLIYVADANSDNVTVLAASNLANYGNFSVGQQPWAIAFDPANGLLYVTDSASNTVSVVNPETQRTLANLSVGTYPVSVAVDPANGLVYVGDSNSNELTVIRGTHLLHPGTIAVGVAPIAVAYDPENARVLVGNVLSGTLSVLATVYAVTFHASGLPSGSPWTVGTVQGSGVNTTVGPSGKIQLLELPGPVDFTIAPPAGYGVSQEQSPRLVGYDALDVVGSTSVNVRFGPLEIVTFTESGLPAGSSWSVTLQTAYAKGGPPGLVVLTTQNQSISTELVRGSWKFVASGPTPYAAHPAHGVLTVPAHSVVRHLRFAA